MRPHIPTHIVDMGDNLPTPLTLDISVPDDKGVKLLSVYVGFICYVIPEQSKTCYAVIFALEVLLTTCCNFCLIIFRFFQEKFLALFRFQKSLSGEKLILLFSKGLRLHQTADTFLSARKHQISEQWHIRIAYW